MQSATELQRADLTTSGQAAAMRVAELVRSVRPEEANRRVPGSEWSAIETAVHVVNLYGRGLGDQRRSQTPEQTAGLNATCLTEYEGRDPQEIAGSIAADAATVWNEVLPLLPDDLAVPFHAGTSATVVPIMGVLLSEMLVHGDDIARAVEHEWSIDDADAWRALQAMAELLPAWRRAGVHGFDTVALVGPDGDAVRITCDPDDTSVSLGPVQPADRLAPDRPADALLGLFGRRRADGPLADLAARFGPF